jgi:formate dehydrogenase (NADP+) alpha subunit
MPTLTLNGQSFPFTPGATLLEIAQHNGIKIPTLCNYPQLKPAGMCRMCMVEVEGLRGTMTACTTPASDGMVVRTDTPALLELRREILSLILSEHPYTCLVCDRHDRCSEWQVTIRKAKVTTGCENCPKNGQCELQNLVDEIGLSLMPYCISYRGLPVVQDDPFFDRDYNLCIQCGRCVRVCQDVRHTGTLAFIDRGLATVVGTAYEQSHLLTDCEFCGACVDVCPTGALFDQRTKWEGVPERTGRTICPYCSVGCELELWVKQGRSTVNVMGVRPAVDGEVNRGQACARGRFGIIDMIHAPARLRTPQIRKSGRLAEVSWDEALAYLAEKLPAYRGEEFAMLLSPHLTTESAYVMQKFARQGLGSHNVDLSTGLPRIARVAELAGLLDSIQSAPIRSILEARTILVLGANPRLSHPVVGLYIRQAQAAGSKLIVIDPRRTELARRADIWLQVEPGKDELVIKELVAGSKLQVAGGKGKGNRGEEDGKAEVRRAAQLLTENGPALIIFGSGITHYPSAPDTIGAILELTGMLEPHAGLLPLFGSANLRGMLELGAAVTSGEGNYDRIVKDIADGVIKALYLAGEMPALDGLDRLELLVVQDSFLSPNVAQIAHVVLPAASFAEVSGTFTNLEGRHQHFEPVIPPVGESRPDWWIACQLAQAMGLEACRFEKAADVWSDVQVASSEWQVARDSVQVAGRRDQRSNIDKSQFPYTLIVERNQFSYRGSALTSRVPGMGRYKSDEGAVMLNPADASALGLKEGETVRVVSEYGSDSLVVRITPDLPKYTAFTSINSASGSALFPGKLPEVKAYAVKFERDVNTYD